jgi:quaternary ammonium compound-resistance protein SugE
VGCPFRRWSVGNRLGRGTQTYRGLHPALADVGTAAALIASTALLGVPVRTLPLGTAYAVWTGIGTIGTVVLGSVLFHEPATAVRPTDIARIVAGILGLKLAAPSSAP